MIRLRHLTVGVALALAIVAAARAASAAQAAKPAAKPARNAADADARDVNLRAYVELLRSDVRGQKVAILTEMMDFTEQEDAKFWPIYREYEPGALEDQRRTRHADPGVREELRADDRCRRGSDRQRRARPRGAAARAEAEVLRSPQVGAVAKNRRAVPSGGKPAPHDHRPADFSGAAGRQVTRPVNGR